MTGGRDFPTGFYNSNGPKQWSTTVLQGENSRGRGRKKWKNYNKGLRRGSEVKEITVSKKEKLQGARKDQATDCICIIT
jgi:hypothetical protein